MVDGKSIYTINTKLESKYINIIFSSCNFSLEVINIMFEYIKTDKNGGVYVAAAYAVMFVVSLVLAIAGGIMLLTGSNIMQIIWVYTATLLAFFCCIAIDLAYTFYKRKVAMIRVEAPPVTVEEEAKAKHVS